MATAIYKNLAGFSPEKIALLEKDFAGLDQAGSDLAERAVRYVVDGEDANVLEALKKAHNPAERLRLIGSVTRSFPSAFDCEARVAFFSSFVPEAYEAYLRLAKVFEAASIGGPPAACHHQAFYGNLLWVEIFLTEAMRGESNYGARPSQPTALPIDVLEQMLVADGHDPALLMESVLGGLKKDYMRPTVITRLVGFRESVVKHREIVASALSQADASRKVEILETLAKHEIPAEPFLKEFVRLATSDAKVVRHATAPLLSRIAKQARPLIEQVATDGNPTERALALRWLGRFGGEAARSFLLDRQQAEKGGKIQEAISDALGELGQNPAIESADALAVLPPLPAIETQVPLTPSARQAVADLIEAYNKAAVERNRQLAQHRQTHPQYRQPDSPIYAQSRIDETCRLLETLTDAAPLLDGEPALPLLWGAAMNEPLMHIVEHPDVRLIHLIRLMVVTGHITARQWARPTMAGWSERCLRKHRSHHPPGFTLRELAATLEAIGLDSRMIGYDVLSAYGGRFQWLAPEFPAYFGEHLDLLHTGLDNSSVAGHFPFFEWRDVRTRALQILSRFANLPSSLVPSIWQIAIGLGKTDRAAAQKIMERVPDVRQRLADALGSGDYQTRVVAADWLGRAGDRQAAALLHKALKKEKQDAAKDAMLTALQRLGESIDAYFDRDQLLAEAQRGLKKGLHKDLAWFPVNSWPEVRWENTGELVPIDILNFFLAQTHKLGSPEQGALLRRYCQQFAPVDRETLGRFVLTTWLDYDYRPKYSEAEARQLAHEQALKDYQLSRPWLPLTLAEWEEHHYQMFSAQQVSMAIKAKGILALAAACCGDEAVTIVGDYLKKWYGYRAAQCKALVAMLASLDRPAAIQLLLSVANRFRTKGIREEAEKYVAIVAERKGWTIDELADRTVPTAGFDEKLTLELDYGSRQLIARLKPDLSIALADENGKPLKSLPEPRKDDDADKAKAAKKAFSTAKSDLKKLVAQQTGRLYEAMCTERTWNHSDWETYLHRHPIVGQLCQRLVWGILDGDHVSKTFRPLDDGTLTDENDEQAIVPEGARLRLAHASLLPSETSTAWGQHFADYQVEPVFAQFGRNRYLLSDEKHDATQLTEFEGHLIEAFKLRGHATRLGYARGPAQDGGWFYQYEKTLAGMGLKVVLRFSGNGMPEENRTVALMDLHFSASGGDAPGMLFDRPGIPLREVPGVLLSECYHDLATIAAAGSGYGADWQTTVGM